MKFSVPAKPLGQALAAVKGAIEKKAALPVLAQVLMRLDDDRLTLTGTDLELELCAGLPVQMAQPGAATVNFERLAGLVKALPEGEVTAALVGDRLTLRAGAARFALATLPVESYPALAAESFGPPVTLPAGVLAELLAQVNYAMAQNDVRYYLNAAQLQLAEGLVRVVASDGHRLAYAEAEVDAPPTAALEVLVPRDGALELARALGRGGEVAVSVATNAVRAGLEGLDLAVKLVEGRYPAWRRMVPTQFSTTVSLDRAAWVAALRRVLVIHDAVRLVIGATELQMATAGADADSGAAADRGADAVDCQLDGEPLEILFNGYYLLEALEHVTGEGVELGIAPGAQSAVLRAPGVATAQHIVMPMRG